MKLNCKRIDFTYTPGEEIFNFPAESGLTFKMCIRDRPYTVAVQNKNQEMADYLKALEPEEWHNKQEKIRQLTPYKLPAKRCV